MGYTVVIDSERARGIQWFPPLMGSDAELGRVSCIHLLKVKPGVFQFSIWGVVGVFIEHRLTSYFDHQG